MAAGEGTAGAGGLNGVSPIQLGRLYVFALIWSVGAFLEREDRSLFDSYLRSNHALLPLPPKTKSKEDTIFDFVVGPDGNNQRMRINTSNLHNDILSPLRRRMESLEE